MDLRVVCYVLARLTLAAAGVLVLPCALAFLWGEGDACRAFGLTFGLALALFCVLVTHARREVRAITMREGIAITGLGWCIGAGIGMLPYVLGGCLGFLDGLFESLSGFTGTGATVITALSDLPRSLLFWRSMTHWFGGLGIIVIFIALLPQAGQSTVYMYNAETTGPTHDRVMPRLQSMTGALFRLYAGLTLAAAVIYWLCGMDAVTAANHALSTLGTGGFSTYDENAMAFDNVWIEGWMSLFMIVAGGNFALYYKVWKKGAGALHRNTEFRAYLGILAAAMLLVTGSLVSAGGMALPQAVRYAVFQVASLSTTGFVTADFDRWPALAKGVLLTLMVIGGCAGSTASGLKVSRIVLLVKSSAQIFLAKLHPHALHVVRMNGHTVPVSVLHRVGHFFFLYMMAIVLFALAFTAFGVPIFDAVGISVTTLGNVGPAFGIAGATCTFAPLPAGMKALLCFEMLLGRLEIFTLLAMLQPAFWRTKHPW